MARYNRGEARYNILFLDWENLDRQYRSVDGQRVAAFTEFDELQRANIDALQQARVVQQSWEDEAFENVDLAFEAKFEASGRDMVTDTTTADGVVRFGDVSAGQWWVHARYETATVELYWNVVIDVPKGEIVEVRLTRANALERPRL